MDKLILSFIILFSKIIVAAESSNKVIDIEQHIVGATLGIQFHNINNELFHYKVNGYGGDIFYRYLYSSITDISWLPPLNLYLSVNAEYTQYENKGIKRKDIPVTLGMYFYEFSEWLDVYFGVGLGILYRTENFFSENAINITPSNVFFIAATTFGIFIPISGALYLDINLKNTYTYKDLANNKFSIGISYSF